MTKFPSSEIVLFTDFYRGSYKIIGSFYYNSFIDISKTHNLSTSLCEKERKCLIQKFGQKIVFHNTLGQDFVCLENSYNIALPAHEWSEYPQNWIQLLNQFDEVWTTTDHVLEVLTRGGITTPVFRLPPALDSENIPEKQNWNLSEKPKFFFVGEPHFRKGHHLLMQGFMKAFPKVGEALLTIKTSPSCEWESPRNDIILIKDKWPREKLLAEYASHDYYVSASLGEGLGLPLAEAIMAELPICTNFWGGHKSLLTPGGFIEIGHEEIIQPFTSDPAFYAEGQKCAYSSPESISQALKECISISAEKRKEIVNTAKQFFIQNYGYKVTHKSISKRLEEIKLINSQ